MTKQFWIKYLEYYVYIIGIQKTFVKHISTNNNQSVSYITFNIIYKILYIITW